MANAINANMAEAILEKIGINMFLKTRTNPPHQINAVLLKISFQQVLNGEPIYAIMEMSDRGHIISVPTPEEIVKYESYMKKSNWGGASKICNYDISKGFLAECYRDCNFAFTFFSERKRKSLGLRNTGEDLNLVLCGFIMMTIAVDKKNVPYLYIDDVCSLGGMGNMLMNLSKNMLNITNIKNLKLTSLDKPIGFYMHSDFVFEKGTKTHQVKDESKLSYWKRDKQLGLVTTPSAQMKGRSQFVNNAGFVYNNRPGGPMSILRKNVPMSQISRARAKTSKIGGPSGIPSQLVNVKTDNDGIMMSFKFPEFPRDPAIEAIIRGEGEANREIIEKRQLPIQNTPIRIRSRRGSLSDITRKLKKSSHNRRSSLNKNFKPNVKHPSKKNRKKLSRTLSNSNVRKTKQNSLKRQTSL